MPGNQVTVIGGGNYEGSGYRIGDGHILTAGHVVYEWDRDQNNPQFDSNGINVALDYRGYLYEYIYIVGNLPSPVPMNEDIEAVPSIAQRDSVVISRGGGNIGPNDDGLVLFLDPDDLTDTDSSSLLGVSMNVVRSDRSGTDSGRIVDINPSSHGNELSNVIEFSNDSSDGDSGGAYLLQFGGKEYVIGTHFANLGLSNATALGTFFSLGEWNALNSLLEASENGDVTNNEATNLIIGSSQGETITGSFRSDRIFGRGGVDIIYDGDLSSDTVWADDTLIGGEGDDIFHFGRGNDTIWGADLDDQSIQPQSLDKVNYSIAPAKIQFTFVGTSTSVSLTVKDGANGTDQLYSIEELVGSTHHDVFKFEGQVPVDYKLKIDSGGGQETKQDVINLLNASGGIQFTNTNAGGTLKTIGGSGEIDLIGFQTKIIGSEFDDEISDEATGEKSIDGGDGDDVLSAGMGRAKIYGGSGLDEINGGSGNDVLVGGSSADELSGGGGSDYIVAGLEDHVEGDAGSDYIYLSLDDAATGGAEAAGGAGNDVIDGSAFLDSDPFYYFQGATLTFGTGDGRDTLLSNIASTTGLTLGEFGYVAPDVVATFGVEEVEMIDFSSSDASVVIDADLVWWDEIHNPGEIWNEAQFFGDVAIVVGGESILLKNTFVNVGFWWDLQSTVDAQFVIDNVAAVDLHGPEFLLSDGYLSTALWEGVDVRDPDPPMVNVLLADTSNYEVALAQFTAAVAADASDEEGSSGDDDFTGSAGDEAFTGGEGNDSFETSGGDDVVNGGAGDDTVQAFQSYNAFSATRNADGSVTLHDWNGLEGSTRLIDIESIYFAADDITYTIDELAGEYGTEGNDGPIMGTARGDFLYGLGGNDQLYGLEGDDIIDAGAGNDVLYGGEGWNELFGGDGNDTFGNEDVQGVNLFDGQGGVDTLITTAAVGETVTADLEAGTISSGYFDGSTIANVENLKNGQSYASVIFHGDDLANMLNGGLQSDQLFGAGGSDNLLGSSGNDILDGEAGADLLSGGLGEDLFVLKVGEAQGDYVLDFYGNGSGPGDRLEFRDFGPGAFLTQSGSTYTINYGAGLTETFRLSTAALHVTDYAFV